MTTESIPAIDLPKAEFLLKQYEQAHECTLADRSTLHTKANYLIGAGGAVSTFLLSKAIGADGAESPWLVYFLWTLAGGGASITAMMLWTCYMPNCYSAKGAEPESTLTTPYCSQTLEVMLVGQGCDIGKRISLNKSLNFKLMARMRGFVAAFALAPFVAAGVAALLDFFLR